VTTVVGIDPSFTCTGICVWVNGTVRTTSVRTKPTGPRVYREKRIVDSVSQYLNPDDTLVVLIEAVYNSTYGRVSLDLAGLHDVLVYEAISKRATVGVVPAKSAKAFATQKGDASKQDMVDYARMLLGVEVANHNEADALWFATMGVVAMGGHHNHWPPQSDHPVAVANQKNRLENLSKVTWIPSAPTEMLRNM
jgi:Holliday junction resolvasome RuvABC endonuclease subunit